MECIAFLVKPGGFARKARETTCAREACLVKREIHLMNASYPHESHAQGKRDSENSTKAMIKQNIFVSETFPQIHPKLSNRDIVWGIKNQGG